MATSSSSLPVGEATTRVTGLALTRVLVSLAVLAAFVGAIALGVAPILVTPSAAPASVPATQFSAGRALRDLAFVAAEPRPVGSPRAAAVRDYLMEQIRALGLTPQLQRATVTTYADGLAETTAVENVMVRLPGRERGPAVLISGHYDSAPTGPGAADCGSCTAEVLEVLRAIHAAAPLRNDVIFLFTDAEEVGTQGALAFADQHPWALKVGVTLVFEGLGTEGASVLYATTPQSGWLMNEILSADRSVAAYSFMNDIVWALQRNTGSDLDSFARTTKTGASLINLTLSGSPVYHTEADNVARMNPGTLQSHGDHAVALVRYFGDRPLDNIPGEQNLVYFALAPGLTAGYLGGLALPLALVALAIYFLVLVLGLRRRAVSVGGLLVGVFGWLLSLLGAILAVTAVWWALRLINPNLHSLRVGGWYDAELYLVALLFLTLAIQSALYLLFRRRFSAASLLLGSLAWWLVLAVLSARSLPGFSYLFLWPSLAVLVLCGWEFLRAQNDQPGELFPAWLVGGILALALMTPVVYLLAVFDLRIENLLGIPAAALPIPFAVLAFGLLLPALEEISWRKWLPVGAVAMCALLLAFAWIRSGPSPERPTTNTVIYRLDADAGRAVWLTVDDSRGGRGTGAQIDSWTRQFFPNGGEAVAYNPWPNGWFSEPFPALQNSAPVVDLPRGEVQVESDETTSEGRVIQLRVAVPGQALDGQVVLETAGEIADLTVNGKALKMVEPRASVQVSFYGKHAEGVALRVRMTGSDALNVLLRTRIPGLPAVPGLSIAARPASMMIAPLNFVADSSLVEQRWTLK